jgi:hypothetical protein
VLAHERACVHQGDMGPQPASLARLRLR